MLVTAYAQIAEALPRFDRFEEAFKGNPAFQGVLAMVYADILEFHRRTYKFFRRRGASPFFVYRVRALMLCSMAHYFQLLMERLCCTIQRYFGKSRETYRVSRQRGAIH